MPNLRVKKEEDFRPTSLRLRYFESLVAERSGLVRVVLAHPTLKVPDEGRMLE